MATTPGRLRRTLRAIDTSRPMRALMRYLLVRGNLSAGGVTISALVSLVAALTIAVNAFRAVLGQRPELRATLLETVNDGFPGLIDDGSTPGVIDPSTLLLDSSLTWATVVSIPVLWWTATNVMTGLRNSIRSMFGLTGAPIRPVRGKAWDTVGIVLLGVALVLSSLLATAATGSARVVLDLFGAEGSVVGVGVRVIAVLVAGAVDVAVFLLLFRVAAKVRIPWPDRIRGALLGAVGWGLLRLGGTSLIGAWDNALLASFAVLVTLLVWINLGVRWCLLTAAWTANPPHTRLPVVPAEVHDAETPNYVTASAPHTLSWPHHEVTGTLIPDRAAR
jgi:membrane protein